MGKKRTWDEKDLRNAITSSYSIRQVLIKLRLKEAGGNYSQIKKYIDEYNISTKHFRGRGWRKNQSFAFKPRIPLSKILTQNSGYQTYKLKLRLFREGIKQPACEICGWNKSRSDGKIPVELDHINGNSRDNRLKNLRILCPNCHSLQSTHRGLNIKPR